MIAILRRQKDCHWKPGETSSLSSEAVLAPDSPDAGLPRTEESRLMDAIVRLSNTIEGNTTKLESTCEKIVPLRSV